MRPGSLADDEEGGIDRDAAVAQLEVQVRAGAPPRAARERDALRLPYVLADGALARADALFATARKPWSPEIF